MARPLPNILSTLPINIIIIPNFYIIFAFLTILSIFSLVTFLCASHKRQKEVFIKKKFTISRKNLLERLSKANNISSKALLKMVSWRKQVVQHGDEDNYDYFGLNNNNKNNNHDYIVVDDDGFVGEDAVWKKTIIKGEKCKPLEFSGKIEYDSEGNLLHDHDNSFGDDKKKKIVISSNNEVDVS